MNEKDKVIEYIKMLMKEFNTITLLMLITLLVTHFSHPIFTVLFIASLSIVAYKVIKVNSFVNKIDEILKEDIKYTEQVEGVITCHKKISKVHSVEDVEEKIEDTEEVQLNHQLLEEVKEMEMTKEILDYINEEQNYLDEEQENIEEINEESVNDIKEDIFEENIVQEQIEKTNIDELEKMIPVNYVNNFDYVDEYVEEELTTKEKDINENKLIPKTPIEKNNTEEIEEIDISKCIRRLGKGRKASEKAKALALSYGYELKDGETFVAPKKKA